MVLQYFGIVQRGDSVVRKVFLAGSSMLYMHSESFSHVWRMICWSGFTAFFQVVFYKPVKDEKPESF